MRAFQCIVMANRCAAPGGAHCATAKLKTQLWLNRVAHYRLQQTGVQGDFMSVAMTKAEVGELVGQELGRSDWLLIDQDRIDRFADVTEDHQYIHVDPERAASSPFGGTIAHGMLTLSLIVGMCGKFAPNIEGLQMVINYGFDKVRFASPVKVNKRIRAIAKLIEAKERAGQLIVKTKVTIEIEGETKPALVAEWLTMHVVSKL
jgi:acyl dehydratase